MNERTAQAWPYNRTHTGVLTWSAERWQQYSNGQIFEPVHSDYRARPRAAEAALRSSRARRVPWPSLCALSHSAP